jgi:O-antigen ligase
LPRQLLAAVAIMALLVPALALVSDDGGPLLIYLSALLSVALIIGNSVKRWAPTDWRTLGPAALAFVAPLAAMLIANLINGSWSNSELEKLLRFTLAIPVLWVLLHAPKTWLAHVQWSFLISAFAGSAMLIVILCTPELGRGAVADYGGRYNAVAFANLTLFFGFASLLTIPVPVTRWPRCETIVKVVACILSIIAMWVSETRSSWGLFGVLILVLLLAKRQWSWRTKLSFAVGAVVCLGIATTMVWQSENSRFRELITDVQRYEQQDRDTSIGMRMQLWTAAWMMFKQHPVAGVGVSNFRQELAALKEEGVVTEVVAREFGEPHNDFIGASAGYGVIGLLSILALYFVPAAVFLRRSAHRDEAIHTWATIGLLFTLGYAQFSLTEMMFRNMRSVPIYAVTTVILLALSTPATRLARARN